MPDYLSDHYKTVTRAITQGRLVLFLGAGANLCGRPKGLKWAPGQRTHLPSGNELAGYLADLFHRRDELLDLARVAQYITVTAGDGPLYDELHDLFDADYALTPLHTLFARLPGILRARGHNHCYQLIMTSNYDDVMERAFDAAGEPYDVVVYLAEGEGRGLFEHRPPEGSAHVIDCANEYAEIPLDQDRSLKRPLILKLHGAVDRSSHDRDSFVITEDQYIEYLARGDISQLLPQSVRDKLTRCHFLFLGYGLRDWNLRVILHRIWGEQKLKYKSWAVQLQTDELEEKFWGKRNVDILPVSLEKYLDALITNLAELNSADVHE